jgi:hypothetical protein
MVWKEFHLLMRNILPLPWNACGYLCQGLFNYLLYWGLESSLIRTEPLHISLKLFHPPCTLLLFIPLHSCKHLVVTSYGLVDLAYRGVGEDYGRSQTGEAWSAGIPTNHGTAFHHLGIVYISETWEWCVMSHIAILPECWYHKLLNPWLHGCTWGVLQVVMLSLATVDSIPCNNHASHCFLSQFLYPWCH